MYIVLGVRTVFSRCICRCVGQLIRAFEDASVRVGLAKIHVMFLTRLRRHIAPYGVAAIGAIGGQINHTQMYFFAHERLSHLAAIAFGHHVEHRVRGDFGGRTSPPRFTGFVLVTDTDVNPLATANRQPVLPRQFEFFNPFRIGVAELGQHASDQWNGDTESPGFCIVPFFFLG